MQYKVYYLVKEQNVIAGPFHSIDAAVAAKNNFSAISRQFLSVVRGTIQAEPV